MKILDKFLKESLVTESDLYKQILKTLTSKQSISKVMSKTGIKDKDIINHAFLFVTASIDAVFDEYGEYGDTAPEMIVGWLHDDFPEFFSEYLEDEVDMSEDEIESVNMRAIADAIAELIS